MTSCTQRTFLQLLKTFKRDFELVIVGKLGRVVKDLDAQKRNYRHLGLLCKPKR